MSSHHIVRDDQEPALIIANGASCSDELMGQLLEWSPLVIVLDSAIERVLEFQHQSISPLSFPNQCC